MIERGQGLDQMKKLPNNSRKYKNGNKYYIEIVNTCIEEGIGKDFVEMLADDTYKTFASYFASYPKKEKQKILPPHYAHFIVRDFNVSPRKLKDIIPKEIYPYLLEKWKQNNRDNGSMEKFAYSYGNNPGEELSYQKACELYVSKAKKSVLIAEYVPGIHSFINPTEQEKEAYANVHKPVFAAIEEQLEANDKLKYKRIFCVPSTSEEDSTNYAIPYSVPLTLRHMRKVCGANYNKNKQRCFAYAQQVKRTSSFAIIDGKYILEERRRIDYTTDGHGVERKRIVSDILTAFRIGDNEAMKKFHSVLNKEMEHVFKNSPHIDFSQFQELRLESLHYFISKLNKMVRVNVSLDKGNSILKDELGEKSMILLNNYFMEKLMINRDPKRVEKLEFYIERLLNGQVKFKKWSEENIITVNELLKENQLERLANWL